MQKAKLLVFINPADTSRHVSSANTAIYPNLGLLTLMSAAKDRIPEGTARWAYLDGTLIGNLAIEQYLDENIEDIAIICVTALTSNYGAGLSLCRRTRSRKPEITTIFGNDHFSAIHERALRNRAEIDYGFYGNDVVEGFAAFAADVVANTLRSYDSYPGLVYRGSGEEICRNPEDPGEYQRLPFVDYDLLDSAIPHRQRYLIDQQKTYFFMRERELRSQVVDIGRGCIKFAGPRDLLIPVNACDFCAIIPGVREITSPEATRAWQIIENAVNANYNYLYVTADELPLTLWPMLRGMINSRPEWYMDLAEDDRPAMFGYTRAEAFSTAPDRIRALIDELKFDHFFIGFDGMSEISLRVMNKQAAGGRGRKDDPMAHNLKALDSMVHEGGLVTAGLVLTHLGITPEIMQSNYEALEELVTAHPKTFAALDFGPLCPIPGSQSFTYMTHPERAEGRAKGVWP